MSYTDDIYRREARGRERMPMCLHPPHRFVSQGGNHHWQSVCLVPAGNERGTAPLWDH